MVELNTLAVEIHKDNVKKGWWDMPRSLKECINLAIGELYEALEADRTGKWCTSGMMQTYLDSPTPTETFKRLIKDNVQDEIADTFIRMLDLCGHWGLQFEIEETPETYGKNFNEDIFTLTNILTSYFRPQKECGLEKIDHIMSAIVVFSKAWNIDLMWHVEHKLKYNRTRPYKHGKNY